MTIDDIIAAFRSVQADIYRNMQGESPHYSADGAYKRTQFINDFLSRFKYDLTTSSYLMRWGETNPDEWDDIMDQVFAKLGIDTSPSNDKICFSTKEFWDALSKGL